MVKKDLHKILWGFGLWILDIPMNSYPWEKLSNGTRIEITILFASVGFVLIAWGTVHWLYLKFFHFEKQNPEIGTTNFQCFEGFLVTKIFGLKEHLKNQNRNLDLISLWVRNVENGFKTAYGISVSEEVYKRLSHIEELVLQKFQGIEAVDKLIERYINCLETVKQNLTSYGLLSDFKPENLKKFEREG